MLENIYFYLHNIIATYNFTSLFMVFREQMNFSLADVEPLTCPQLVICWPTGPGLHSEMDRIKSDKEKDEKKHKVALKHIFCPKKLLKAACT